MATILTKNFTLEELCASPTARALGIRNVPDDQTVAYLTGLAIKVLQPLRDWWGERISLP